MPRNWPRLEQKEKNELSDLSGSEWFTKPDDDQIEITLFGPGYGESIVMHIGGGCWIIIDSCVDNSVGLPAPLEYLQRLGCDPQTDVKLVLVTHWHDDHIRGMSKVVDICRSAKFSCSQALGSEEFLAMVRAFKTRPMIKAGPGVREIDAILDVIGDRNQTIVRAGPNRAIFRLAPEKSGHGAECVITTLSPSDHQYTLFLNEIASLIPGEETKRRATPQTPNHLTVVTWVQIGGLAFLLGGDLEEINNPKSGWQVIVSSEERPLTKATVFKIPHHGSENGHLAEVWTDMLVESPFALLTPWNRSTKLPKESDINRITKLTNRAYSTSSLAGGKRRRHNQAVEKTLSEMNIRLREVEPPTGAVRLRNGGRADTNNWTVQLRNKAYKLTAA